MSKNSESLYYEDDFEKGEPHHSPEQIEAAIDAVRSILAESVHISTGRSDFAPRPGQLRLAEAITTSAMLGGDVGLPNIAEAPTGLGKSFAGLAPCAYMASLGYRTVIATESIGLQSQYVDKDAPVIAEAAERVTGYRPQIAVFKGWSNYVCLASATSAAEQILGIRGGLDSAGLIQSLEALSTMTMPTVNGIGFRHEEIVPLVIWALRQGDGAGTGDKVKYPHKIADMAWQQVSLSPSECVGKKCPLVDICLPRQAKAEAAEADIIVTNHSMIAVQAATGLKVVLGNSSLGPFDIVVVDEAHALPANVRNQGRGEVSGRRILSLARAITRLLDENMPDVQAWVKRADPIAKALDAHLRNRYLRSSKPGDVVRVAPSDAPLSDYYDTVDRWLADGAALADRAKSSASTAVQLNYKRFSSKLDALSSSVDSVDEHKSGVARWVELPTDDAAARGNNWASAQSSPVDVSGMLRFNVWEDRTENPDNPDEVIVKPRTVVNMSATLPTGFGFQVGIGVRAIEYESPFAEAYSKSAFYCPAFMDDPDFAENWIHWDPSSQRIIEPTTFDASILGSVSRYGRGEVKFDTHKHVNWAAAHMIRLVQRNGGRALVLSANRRAGEKTYVPALRAALRGTGINVLSQWEGESLANLIARWKADETAVLVGTRSLMTGVDAPGQTASLIVIDRPPRAFGNPVDDARVELVMDRMNLSKWDADRYVYVSDAALLMEQAGGRGIRQIDDQVLIAVLDPRMVKGGEFTYNARVRAAYNAPFKRYGEHLSHIEDAFSYIDDMRAAHPSASTPPMKMKSTGAGMTPSVLRPEGGIDFGLLLRMQEEADAAAEAAGV